jgi:hypothetical protein
VSATDSIIVTLATVLVASLYLLLWRPGAAGIELSVWVSGEETMRVPLSVDRRIEVDGAIGTSIIEISNDRARVVDSPGPRKICVRTGWLREAGESAICLPNEVVIRVEGADPRFDGMNF